MGQAATKEHRHGNDASSSSATSPSYPSTVDGGALEPQGVYPPPHDYDHDVVKSAIVQRKLMPFYKGQDDEEAYSGQVFNTECPICFLYYPSTLNQTRCCSQPICTECFVAIKRADPNHTNPPSSQPAECPFCTADNFGVVFAKPNLSPADEAQGEGSTNASHTRRKSFAHTNPDVLTTDMVRPDWQQKLSSAQATILRRANRRIIMRQVGERLVPIGVSSSRVGAELPEGTGPGGAIILREGEEWGPFSGNDNGPRNRRSSRRGGASGSGITQIAGQDMEEMMLMEAMRLSLLEHEEQQRRQAQQQQQQSSAAATSVPQAPAPTTTSTAEQHASSPSNSSSANLGRSSSTSRGQPMAPASRRANRLSQDIRNATPLSETTNITSPARSGATAVSTQPAAPTSSTSTSQTPRPAPAAAPIDFGLRDDVLGELAELIDEPNDDMKRRIETTRAARQARESMDAAHREDVRRHDEVPSSSFAASAGPSRHPNVVPPPASSAAWSGAASPRLPSSATASPFNTPPGSPSTSSRALSPNNPFRSRLASSSGTSSPARFAATSGHTRAASHSEAGGAVPFTGAGSQLPFAASTFQSPWNNTQHQQDGSR